VYLCAVRDVCSCRVIGWAMDSVQTSSLVERALRMAYVLRGGGPAGVVFHADRGTQYTSAQLNDVCVGLGIMQSVARTGVCWNNAIQESLWSTLKTEFYDRRRWVTRQDAIRETGRWIEEFDSHSRLHSAMGYITPVEHEQFLASSKRHSAQAA
jgi:putative transposase